MQEMIRLILVDDHPFVRDGVRMRLEATEDIRVVGEASTVAEAVELAAQDAPHIVLTDISMREVGGIQLAALFRDRFPQTHVLVLSMHDNPEYVRRVIDSGARGYVLKDAPAQQLVDAIHTVHAGGTFFSPGLQGQLGEDDMAGHAGSALTPRESATLTWLARGYSNKQIARELGVSVRTVETHRLHLRRKLRIEGQAELVKYAIDHTLPGRPASLAH